MPKFDADTHRGLCEPITFTLGGREFTVVEPTDESLSAMEQIGQEVEAGSLSIGEALNRKLAVLTGEPESTFSGAPIRRKGAVCRWATAQMLDPLGDAPPRSGPN